MKKIAKNPWRLFALTNKFSTLFAVFLITCIFMFQSCQKGENSPNNLPEIGLDLSGLDFNGNLDFVNKPFLISGETETALQTNLNEALTQLEQNFTDAKLQGYKFQVRRLSKQYEIIILGITEKGGKGEVPMEKSICPEGMDKYSTCLTEECVRADINTLAMNMGVGQGFSVHRVLLAVVLCASPELIEAIQ